MNLKNNTIGIFVALLSVFGYSQEKEKPNIIVIMADDHANRTISAYGSGLNNTPNIDRIANEGALMLNSFNANSICGPSRASILTGKHSHLHGVMGNGFKYDNTQTTFPRELKKNGYQTVLIGKWHLNSNPGDSFTSWKILKGAGGQGYYYNPDFLNHNGEISTEEGYSTDIITNYSLEWLNKNSDTPFCLFVHYKATHVPRMPEFRYLDKYTDVTFPEPETLHDDFSTREPYGAKAWMGVPFKPGKLYDEHDFSKNIYFDRMTVEQRKKWHAFKDKETLEERRLTAAGKLDTKKQKRSYGYQKFIKDYIRCVDGIDDNVGRILEYLDKNPKLKENTIIIYASDQSYFTGQHGFAEKRFMYEDGVKMPILLRWPSKVKAGTKLTSMVQNIDLGPTILDAAGLPIPEDMQGVSIKEDIITGNDVKGEKSIYYHYYDHGKHNVPRHDGVRTNQYKLINYYTDNAYEFYDLEKDPEEVKNLYGNKKYKETIDALKVELALKREKYEVPDEHFEAPYVSGGKKGHGKKKNKKALKRKKVFKD
ncbi:sulfatase [Tamlana sp. 2201CG12-4]|uniref:sulfatase family protein n=1 Tax=Tamlana sp. 2201CG12-4 TaxID=3112582 RepID=UPI002DBE5856|nr:sulfatase [Tamlana sp. 2201CG12-4]MEC3905723.1 sulfatase [Tamlana sp. 2201CG12-4]